MSFSKRDKQVTPLKLAIEKLLKAYKIEDKMDELDLHIFGIAKTFIDY